MKIVRYICYNRFESEEEHWAFLLELYKMMNEIPPQKPTYEYLKNLIGDKPVHYVTTNQDMLFTRYFPENEVSEVQGSWHYFAWTSNVDHYFALAGFDNLFEIEGNWLDGVCSAHPKKHAW